jgi:hypothetical protein
MAAKYNFEHKGKTYSVPAFRSLPMGAIRKARKATDDMDKAFIIIESILGEDSKELKAIDEMDAAQFQAFLEGWTDGAPLGESSDS